ncbi:methionyl-tRNA formyltransferase [Acinetobacter bereziniae]|uniref:Methionyl-tRNA formyltransferase n=1 Tax=Acinetobacter bereziniae LMG 1003 = CIP 70.12 TaxID=981324 RepID=N9CW27_ACIBZ|nr:methionyl-tRNA formyltransferase [Acinetobacter bereziniae]ATZ65640.1 methionyl-tRNA formyltransferase [Acinetobacter bereziniae]ENV89816.1 methionyl-tRNA formyltransferase [Acinetobacter bereziniae LMG 1003 = CIP 70.12]MCU4317459.1 methionyl-tRNA formyltransferase [Acinetobacter bereziniae]MDG3558395.1 methionyl-tRNA formyltransferase [Acinetobacter bereziniae]MDP6003875.1 methionyl-tRNA formyltransferase [Acinetobacter bereziniae]
MKIIFAGTPEFAASALAALIQTDHEIVAVYTQPDRKSGRGQKLTASAVKQLALTHDLPVYQPLHFKASTEEGLAAQQELAALGADVMVVAAYGLILPQSILDTPKYGCLNIHGSLLPRWRGAAPIQRAIATGDTETGVTIMKMAAGLDTGDMLYKTLCPITTMDTSASLYEKLATQGAQAICTVLESEQKLLQYLEAREVQDEQFTVYAHKLTKAEAQIDWRKSAIEIDRTIRAFNPWPVAFTPIDESNNLRIWNATISNVIANGEDVGTIIEMDKQGVHVVCGKGVVCLTSLQWPGGKAVNPVQIIQGHKLSVGHQFA